jgi:hypothetical protein
MTQDHVLILAILFSTVGLCLWGRWRHDRVPMGAFPAGALSRQGLKPEEAEASGPGSLGKEADEEPAPVPAPGRPGDADAAASARDETADSATSGEYAR